MALADIFSTTKDIVIAGGIIAILIFGYFGLFGNSGALQMMKENNIRMEERDKLFELQMQQNIKKMEDLASAVSKNLEANEAARQHIGTTARESYHPDMKSYSKESIDEQIKSANDLFNSYGLSSK